MLSIYILNMKGKKPSLSIRQRVIYARLTPLRRPVTAMGLARMLGGLMDRQTIATHLKKLSALGLVRQSKDGWVALEPSGDMAKEFTRLKETQEDGRWHGCFAWWRLPLPADKPFPDAHNKCELYCAYWLVRGLEIAEKKKAKPKRVMSVKRISSLLGVTRLTARKLLMTLRDAKLFDKHKVLPHHFKFQEQDDAEAQHNRQPAVEDDADLLDVAVDRLKLASQIHVVISQLTAEGPGAVFRFEVCRVVENALREHKKNGYPGDGSPLVLDWLTAKLRTRQSREDAGQQAVAESIELTVRQAEAIAKLDQEVAEARRVQQTVYDLVAAKALPGENCKASLLKMLGYKVEELEAALPKLKDGMTRVEICNVIRPSVATGAKPGQLVKPYSRDDNLLREPVPVIMPTPEVNARFQFLTGDSPFGDDDDFDLDSLPDDCFVP